MDRHIPDLTAYDGWPKSWLRNDRTCEECGKTLYTETAILVDDRCYCFKHAKEVYDKKVDRIDDIYKELLADFQKQKQAHDQTLSLWNKKRSECLKDHGLPDVVWWLAYFIAVAVGWRFIAGFSVLVLAIVVSVCRYKFNLAVAKEFDDQNPRPEFAKVEPVCEAPPYVEADPRNNDPKLLKTGYDRLEIFRRDGFTCQNWKCGKHFDFSADRLEAHHVKPVSKGGTDSIRNLVTLCLECHENESWFGHVHFGKVLADANSKTN
jgi:hypothetical protein